MPAASWSPNLVPAHAAREGIRITVRITDINRMPAANENLGEQIVELLPRLRRFARSLVQGVQDADDLVQLAVERALSRANQLRRKHSRRAGCSAFCVTPGSTKRARAAGAPVFAPEELGENVADPRPTARQTPIGAGSHGTPADEQREVISLVLVEGLSYKEAAEIVGVPVGTITSRLARGRERLQASARKRASA